MGSFINVEVTIKNEEKGISKFDALVSEFNKAKAIADNTQSTYGVAIKEIGDKKLLAIKEQLQTVEECVKKLSQLTGNVERIEVYSHLVNGKAEQIRGGNLADWYLIIDSKNGTYINGFQEHIPAWFFEENGVVTNWNKSRLYDFAQEACEKKLEQYIKRQLEKDEKIRELFQKITND
jgi:hypothetical protein